MLLALDYLEGTEPLALVDLGTSAGLNLLLDRYRYGAEEIVVAQIPAHLRKLAEELLPRGMIGTGSIAEAVDSHQLSN